MLAALAMVVTLLFATPPPRAVAVTDETPAFVLNQNDLEFILRQIQISEAHAADRITPSNYELYCPNPGTRQDCVINMERPQGVRTVTGEENNVLEGNENFGTASHAFPRLLEAEWRQAEPAVVDLDFPANSPAQAAECVAAGKAANATCYEQTAGIVYDSEPRKISNLIVDQTITNPAIVNQLEAGTAFDVDATGRVVIPNTAPDEELSAPFNTFMGFFGQFFDHGLDLVGKGSSGTMVVPLAEDDPLYCVVDPTPAPDNELGGVRAQNDLIFCDPDANYLTLTRATRMEDDPTEHQNLTSPFIDQNQTYTSHPAHQVFLREYVTVNGQPQATGRLIEGRNAADNTHRGGMAKWRDVKWQARTILGIELTDADLLDVPQVHVDPYGNFIPGPNGFPQLLTGNPNSPTLLEGTLAGNGLDVPENALGTGHAFLDDIAHGATPVVDAAGNPLPAFDANGDPIPGMELSGYDNLELDEHFIAGDGRVNENIGLTAVHAVFHAEHNRMRDEIHNLLSGSTDYSDLWAQDSEERGGILEFAKAFRGETHSYVSDKPEENLPGYVPLGSTGVTPVPGTADDWSYEERLFQAAKFATEMQYQHLVFEEFARKIAPTIDAVVFNENSYDAARNPSITAEFAHVVYRFGHSMMTEVIGREAVEGGTPMEDISLLDGFLNPTLFDENQTLSPAEAAGSLVNGMTGEVGSQIDEHVVDVLRNNLLGLPLDLPTMNLLRGRDVGIPPLQAARASFFAETADPSLRPYTSWFDFGLNTKNGNNFGRAGEKASLVNFVAAYGTHPSILAADTLAEKRDAAALLVNGAPLGREFLLRLAGPDRYATARAIALRHFTAPVPVAYIAPGNNFPDALAGGALAAATHGPILLAGPNDTGELPLATALALGELRPQRIVVLGGPGVVGPRTVAALNAVSDTDAPVTRLSGADRFGTAAAIAGELEPGRRVFIADGMNFPDALAGAAVAAADGSAVLLVTRDSIPAATRLALLRLDPSEIVILGQTGAVSATVATQLGAYTDGAVTRLGGADRYATAIEITKHFFPQGADTLYLATGANFPDALTATPGAGINGAPLLLVPPTGLTPALRAEIARLAPDQIRILGGTGVVSAAVELALAAFAPEPLPAPVDRVDFMNSTGAWANVGGETVTGLEDVDFWVGGLAERLDPFGGMLGSTFNYVFEKQLEDLQFGDRFYYLFRNEGEQLFAALEGNTFSDIIQRNTDASHLPADIFALQDPIINIAEQAALPPDQREPGLILDTDGTWRWSGDEHVEIHGTPGNDRLRGDEGDDAIWGYAGDDVIEGGSGNDALVGGTGDDRLTDLFGDDNIKGMQGNDYINVGSGADLAIGGLGDDFMANGAGEGTVFFAGMGDDIVTSASGRFQSVIGGEHDDWIEGGIHADLLQGDNADQDQNDTLGGNDVVAGRLGDDDVEGEGGDDILIGNAVGTDRNHGGLGFDWLTYYGQTAGVTADMTLDRNFNPTGGQAISRFDFLEAISGGAGNDTIRGPLAEPDDLTVSEIELQKATDATIDLVTGLRAMLQPAGTGLDLTLPIMRGTPESDTDGVHKILIGGPGSDTIEGRGGNDYLDGDAYLRVQLRGELNDGTIVVRDTAAQLQSFVASGQLNPGNIDIVREIAYDPNTLAGTPATDIAFYRGSFAEYTITSVGLPGPNQYWRIQHTQVQEPEESDGFDVIRGFERLQFADGCATLNADSSAWVMCDPAADVTMSELNPVEDTAVQAQVWVAGSDPQVAFPLDTVTDLRYTWWAGEGDAPDNITEWEIIEGATGPSYVPGAVSLGSYLRVQVTFIDPEGFFRSATSAPSLTPVAAGPNQAPVGGSLSGTLVPGGQLIATVPTDPDGMEENEDGDVLDPFTFTWFVSTDGGTTFTPVDDSDPATPNTFVIPEDAAAGTLYRVNISFTDLGGFTENVEFTSGPVVVAP